MSGISISENSTARGVIESLRWMDLYGVKTFFGTFIEDIYRVSPDDIRQIAARYLTPNRMAIVVVGDRKALVSQLEEIGRVVD